MSNFIYIIAILFATTLGALAGIGGGVIVKPVFDAFGEYTAAQISVISSGAVFAMSLVSTLISSKQLKEQKQNLKILIPLALGAVVGGYAGEYAFSALTASDAVIRIVQNSILLVLIVFVVIYMKNDSKKSLERTEWYFAAVTGLLLGCVSAFLGIGGGPINVAVITLVFGLGIKTAVIGSLITILFAQGTKLISIAVKDASVFNIKLLPFVIITGICGAVLGRTLNKKASDKTVNRCFIAVQIVIILLCIFNIVKYVISIY